jgi:Flp pilus assembly pilin Flp
VSSRPRDEFIQLGIRELLRFPHPPTLDPSFHREWRSAVLGYLKRQAGQGMTEYIVVVALVAVAAIAVYQSLGQVVRSQTAAMARELAGEDGSAQSNAARLAVQKAAGQTKARSLKSFTGNAAADQ